MLFRSRNTSVVHVAKAQVEARSDMNVARNRCFNLRPPTAAFTECKVYSNLLWSGSAVKRIRENFEIKRSRATGSELTFAVSLTYRWLGHAVLVTSKP